MNEQVGTDAPRKVPTREVRDIAEIDDVDTADEDAGDEFAPGPLEDEKRADDPALGRVEPQEAEVESARLLANDARSQLSGEGLSEEEIRQLADEFVARDRGDEVGSFVTWVRERARHHDAEPPRP
ncbi:MAG: hypothetical protein ACRDY7_00635 [Acidimicrobiia bacterium]